MHDTFFDWYIPISFTLSCAPHCSLCAGACCSLQACLWPAFQCMTWQFLEQ